MLNNTDMNNRKESRGKAQSMLDLNNQPLRLWREPRWVLGNISLIDTVMTMFGFCFLCWARTHVPYQYVA